jgi:hypothetical protein
MKKADTLYRKFSFLVMLLVIFVTIPSVLSAGEIVVNGGKTDVKITQQSYVSFTVSATVSSVEYRNVQTKLGAFTELFSTGFGFSNVVGDPKLPVIHKLIEVPLNAGYSILILEEKYTEIDLAAQGIHNPVIPAQAPLSKNITDPSQVPFVMNDATYQRDAWNGEPRINVTTLGILRSMNLARLDLSPVWYNPVTGKLRIYEKLVVKVVFTNADVAGTLQLKKSAYSPYFENLGNGLVSALKMPDSLITHAPVTYVIVSPPEFQSALQPFIAWKKKKGFKVIEAYTTNPSVGSSTTSIKNYLQGLYNNPPFGYQKPSFVLFVGDVAQVPAWTTNGHPSDYYYCEYTNDHLPEVFWGRFSATMVSQLQPYIDKTLEYEQYTMFSDAYLGEASMIAGADATNGPIYGNGQINYGTSTYFNSAHNILSHTYLQPEPSGGNYSQLIHQDVSNGVCYSNYTAHGSEAGWADPSFVISDIPALQNAHKYCLMVGNCCKTANFGTSCFAEEIVRASNKGALGYIGCSDYSYWDEDYWWACGFKTVTTNPAYNAQHLGAYDVTFHDHGEPASKWFVTQGQMVVGGNLAVEESSSGIKLYYWETYCLMGDPSLSVYFSVPQPVVANYTAPLLVGESTLAVTTEAYAYVALTVNDTTLLDAQCADSTGIVNLSFAPLTSPDSLSIVVTKQNRKPHIGSIQVIPATGPYVVLNQYTVDDSIGGNHDHDADYSEAVKLNVTVKNIGVMQASNITGTLTTQDTNIVITSSVFNFGNVNAGGTITGNNAFSLTVGDDVADQHHVNCNLALTDGTNVWNSTLILTLNAPVFSIGAVTVLDPAPGGNGNGVLDPGESATLKILTTNTGHATAINTIGHLTVSPASAPFILVNNPTTYVGSMTPGTPDYVDFAVVTNGITPPGTAVTLDYRVTGGSFNQYSAQKDIDLVIGESPVYLMGNSTTITCGGKFYDSGGASSNYSDNEDLVYTFEPATTGANIRAVFSAFDVESETNCGYDWLKVYNGPDVSSTLLGTYCGTNGPGTLVSTNGPLTFEFHADYSVTLTGWAADISCAGGPLNVAANAFPASVCQGSSSQLTAIVTGGSGTYTYQWTPATYLDDPTSRTPVSTPDADITYTVTVNDGSSNLTSGSVQLTIHALPATPVIYLTGSTLTSNVPSGNQWFLNGAMIPGATDQEYTPTASGWYNVVEIDPVTGCQSLPSNSINLLLTQVDNLTSASRVTVFPNPFRDNLSIAFEMPVSGSVQITLYDAFGKEISRISDNQQLPEGTHQKVFSAGNLTNGVYTLKIKTPSYSVLKKVIFTH